MEPPPDHPTPTPRSRIPLGRAAFLGTVAAGIGGIAVLSRFGGGVGASLASLGDNLGVAAIVPTGGWRIYNVQDPMPTFDPATYSLTIDGNVENPVTLTWSDVQATEMVTEVSDFHCVTGWSVYDVRFRGIKAQTILDLVKPRAEAQHVNFQSLEEPYFDQLTMKQFMLPTVMLATAMDGKPLTRPHGAPMRLVIPQMYGYKGVKWLSKITFENEPTLGYWETRGYDADAWVGKDVSH
jgi:DMSO/TMAO reductase YedYZ molybdopterin-dependent catalytic subunit